MVKAFWWILRGGGPHGWCDWRTNNLLLGDHPKQPFLHCISRFFFYQNQIGDNLIKSIRSPFFYVPGSWSSAIHLKLGKQKLSFTSLWLLLMKGLSLLELLSSPLYLVLHQQPHVTIHGIIFAQPAGWKRFWLLQWRRQAANFLGGGFDEVI